MFFVGASIVAMIREFSNEPRARDTASAARGGAREPVADSGEDSLDFAQPNEPPRGLMRKRPHVAVWILAALLLGGLIALLLVGLASG